MKKQWYILVICTLSFVTMSFLGCRPKGILSSREMRSLLVDLHKTDGLLQISGGRIMENEVKDLYYAQVLEKHGVTQAQFDSSLVWYTAHPQFFNKIYPKVLKELEAEEAAFNELHATELANVEMPESIKQPASFTRDNLDSTLWVIQNGYGHSWKQWEKPFRMTDGTQQTAE